MSPASATSRCGGRSRRNGLGDGLPAHPARHHTECDDYYAQTPGSPSATGTPKVCHIVARGVAREASGTPGWREVSTSPKGGGITTVGSSSCMVVRRGYPAPSGLPVNSRWSRGSAALHPWLRDRTPLVCAWSLGVRAAVAHPSRGGGRNAVFQTAAVALRTCEHAGWVIASSREHALPQHVSIAFHPPRQRLAEEDEAGEMDLVTAWRRIQPDITRSVMTTMSKLQATP